MQQNINSTETFHFIAHRVAFMHTTDPTQLTNESIQNKVDIPPISTLPPFPTLLASHEKFLPQASHPFTSQNSMNIASYHPKTKKSGTNRTLKNTWAFMKKHKHGNTFPKMNTKPYAQRRQCSGNFQSRNSRKWQAQQSHIPNHLPWQSRPPQLELQ